MNIIMFSVGLIEIQKRLAITKNKHAELENLTDTIYVENITRTIVRARVKNVLNLSLIMDVTISRIFIFNECTCLQASSVIALESISKLMGKQHCVHWLRKPSQRGLTSTEKQALTHLCNITSKLLRTQWRQPSRPKHVG